MRAYYLVFLAFSAAACAPAWSGTTNQRPGPTWGALTTEDLAPYRDALSAVRSLRRQWLYGRSSDTGEAPAVFVDGVLTMGLETLAGFNAPSIREIRYLPGVEATTRFGNQYSFGVILVTTFR